MSPLVMIGILLLEVGVCFGASDWAYRGRKNPWTWSKKYPACAGSRQSPIFFEHLVQTSKPELTWSGFDVKPESMTLSNDGHTAVLSSKGAAPNITTDDGKVYELGSVRFHWGGSEHYLGEDRVSMEMQSYYVRVDKEYDPAAAFDMLVVVTFVKSRYRHGKEGMENFAGDMHKVIDANTETSVEPFPWSELLPTFNDYFIWYEGSLTSPPCTQGVTYFVSFKWIYVTDRQMDMFWKLLAEDGKPLAGNHRPLQSVNGRHVYMKEPA